jgi:ABC-2 type transport system ATP-binding protein
MKKKQLTSVALKVDHVSKSFHLPLEKASGLKQAFINRMRGVNGYTEQKVLKDISFEIKKGEFFGIVGRNGSGKSTLLKLISQIYTPNKGKITVNGSLVPFIELGVGFNPELTGRENVYLNGAMLGFSRPEIDAMYDEIVEFAELHDFMDQKLKNYSSGMQVRLAFSVAIKAEGDILVLDEVLAVGDEAFQRKCFAYFAELKKNKKTVILVTHDMGAVQKFCTRAIMIEKGNIVAEGDTVDVSHKYQELFMNKDQRQKVKGREVHNDLFNCRADVKINDNYLNITVRLKTTKDINETVLTLGINKSDGEQVFRWISDDMLGRTVDFKKNKEYKLTAKIQNIFAEDSYTIGVRVKDKDRAVNYAIFDKIKEFDINRKNGSFSWDVLLNPRKEFNLEEK